MGRSLIMGCLPDGSETKNEKKYLDAWHELAKPFEDLTGLKLYGYDPSCSFIGEGKCYGWNGNIEISVAILKRINAGLEKIREDYEEHIDELLTNSGD